MNLTKIDNDYIRLGNKAAMKYIRYLDKEDIKRCIAIAAWKTDKTFNPEEYPNTKKTSYFVNVVNNEFRSLRNSFLRAAHKNRRMKDEFRFFNKRTNTEYVSVELMDMINFCDDPKLIYDKFVLGKTIRELSKESGITENIIRSKILKNINKLKIELADCV